MLDIKIERLGDHDLPVPSRGSRFAAGFDLRTTEAFTLMPGERKLVPTGFKWELPSATYGRVSPRSGLAVRFGIDVFAGVVDSDYRGEVHALLFNAGEIPFSADVGDRIAQLVVEEICMGQVVESFALSASERGANGYGSTGIK